MVIEHAYASVSNLPLTQSQIGQYLGLTVVHINRILRSLRAQRVVYLEKHRAAILDVQQLISWPSTGEIVRSSAAGLGGLNRNRALGRQSRRVTVIFDPSIHFPLPSFLAKREPNRTGSHPRHL
jgi:hypothetical protein